ncbi:unnamed protein product, partial [Cladocopium goreaui]
MTGLPQVQVRTWRGAACFQSFRRRFHHEECCERRPSQVDSRLLFGDSDRLLAGVARLFYRHTVEGDAFESGYLLKITAPEQKGRGVPLRAADFDEVNFAEQLNCRRRFSLSQLWRYFRQPALVDEIYQLLKNIAALSEFKKEMAVLAAIYTERLLKRHPALRLTKKNWRPILIAALHLASKTWEDVHAWNSDFSAYLQAALGLHYPVQSLHRLELQMLTALDYHMEVPGELYVSYYFALTEEIQRAHTPPHLNESLLASSLQPTLEANSTMASERDIQSCSPTSSASSRRTRTRVTRVARFFSRRRM